MGLFFCIYFQDVVIKAKVQIIKLIFTNYSYIILLNLRLKNPEIKIPGIQNYSGSLL